MIVLLVALLVGADEHNTPPPPVCVPLSAAGELDLGEFVGRLEEATGLKGVSRPGGRLCVPLRGVAGVLGRKVLTDALGSAVQLRFEAGQVVVVVPPDALSPAHRADFAARLERLAETVQSAARVAGSYGMRARPSYRPNDPARRTVCLVHGLNSTSDSFVYLAPALEEAGFGIVLYDYPFNRDVATSAAAFGEAWRSFRVAHSDRQPWAILTHSMGAYLARAYVEGDHYGGDVSTLILIAPPNHGAALARNQSLLQLVQGIQAASSDRIAALANLSNGIGEAAADLMPDSAFLKSLNARPRRAGVAYHILAGSAGFVTPETRRRVEHQLGLLSQGGGLVGGLARLAAGSLQAQLDEASAGTGDGCVTIASTRLEGVADHVVIPANHVELIRAPLLYPDPGPIVGLPYVLRWLK